ncbi:MAG: polymer-forming cytoskeletal protein [Candidatus Andersenbacteria bacterium]|nr:polymer-forming cytoskeletal protein [bacterium]MDZ4225318.1 polymer-forming cytoskeletal protein [Candidatus Andersenbacteria bacterium]
MKYYSLAIVLALVMVLPTAAGAAYFAAGENVSPDNAVQDDAYIAGQRVTIDQPVKDDVFAAGNAVEISGSVGQDVYAAGSSVTVSGSVGDDVYAAGNTVRVESPEADDIFAAGNNVTLSQEVNASGDAYLAGSTVEISGTIDGAVKVAAPSLLVTASAVINGDLITYGEEKAKVQIDDGAIIRGEVKHVVTQHVSGAKEISQRLYILNWVRSVVTWFVFALVLLFLLPGLTRTVFETAKKQTLKSFGVGILWLLVAIPLSVLLLVTVVGIPLAIIAVLATIALVITAIGYIAILVGEWVAVKLLKQEIGHNTWQHALMGAVIFATVRIVPLIGGLFVLIMMVLSLGALILALISIVQHPVGGKKK